MNSVAARCRDSFDTRTISRGDEYYRSGAVDFEGISNNSATALVAGSRPGGYRVNLDWSQAGHGELTATCDCPRFDDGFLCKHIWAALLQIDANGIAGKVPGSRHLDVIDDEDFDDGDDEDANINVNDAIRELLAFDIAASAAATTSPKKWRDQLKAVSDFRGDAPTSLESVAAKRREVWYVVNVASSLQNGKLTIEFHSADTKKNGEFGKITKYAVRRGNLDALTDVRDREIMGILLGGAGGSDSYRYGYYDAGWQTYTYCSLTSALYDVVLPRMAATGRLVWLLDTAMPVEEAKTLNWDDGPAWQFRTNIQADPERALWKVRGELFRGDVMHPLDDAVLILADGLVFFAEQVARFEGGDSFPWIHALRRAGPIEVPVADRQEFLQWLWQLPNHPHVEWPNDLQVEQVQGVPQGRLVIKSPDRYRRDNQLFGDVLFVYGDQQAGLSDSRSGWFHDEQNQVVSRDSDAEQRLLAELMELPLRRCTGYASNGADVHLQPRHFADVVHQLTARGWIVESEGRRIRQPGVFSLSVSTDVDWFELDGKVDFDGESASLPTLLRALRNGERFIQLDDGSQGMLPEDWLEKYGQLARLAKQDGESLRFASTQALLLDALLAEQDSASVRLDGGFRRFRDKLRSFSGVQSHGEPRGFHGELREYQREGLGWLHFLRDFNFGGCLADDMGLGKTVQVLALLQSRRLSTKKKDRKPSLAVVPKSLVFNWVDEAARFTPNLRVMNYTGTDRKQLLGQLDDCDVLVTTYGTLRRDIVELKDVAFDYAILDESQAIKNHTSQAAKACRLLQADHRLAMTGTPIENHLGELWSLFEFLNPGMLGQSGVFDALAKSKPDGDDGSLKLLAHAIRPFILRRTKDQVLSELPAKTEQTLFCDLSAKQRKQYDELRDYYRAQLSTKVREVGLRKSKIHVLEALLRLRQAACHPGLLDKNHASRDSAKLKALLEQLDEILSEGHKALVFSQFTSLLAIVRRHLDKRNVTYEYLDGRTRKRGETVKRFQEDPDCQLFLLSLKAGGHGLNLTAADYVFILDPWWNPAVEAQAVDRAHRIGQTRSVMAYRLIARDTVEEKILELQKTKRELADAIVSADNSLIRNLTSDDLQLLLS